MNQSRRPPLPRRRPAPGAVYPSPDDLEGLSHVIAEAFFDLPPSRCLITDEDDRRAIFPGYFRLMAENAMRRGLVYTDPDRSAVALWLPAGPGRQAHDPGYPERLAAVTGRWAARFELFDTVLDRHHPTGAAHFHLAILAVRPGHQCQGVGSALLAASLGVFDEVGAPTYLEAADLGSRRLYRRHGYADHGGPVRLGKDVRMYPMWRDPAAGSPEAAQPDTDGTAQPDAASPATDGQP
jgi:GNAT superfamily N-acetyltransferase